ncbi:MAG: hypothetical protein QF380_09075 [Candidatus Marinimicrobia bacterium]|jgi:hypothetical protein|nr:hypothetical protein [Candidatus Neomarinimicrobiota bacterium]
MKKLLILALLIVGCATIPVENRESIEYTMKMSEDEFKAKNNGLEIYEQNKDGIVYKCNSQYYTFMYGKLEAVSFFPISPNPINFGFPPSTENTQKDSTDTN